MGCRKRGVDGRLLSLIAPQSFRRSTRRMRDKNCAQLRQLFREIKGELNSQESGKDKKTCLIILRSIFKFQKHFKIKIHTPFLAIIIPNSTVNLHDPTC